jgi:hypothetical protein
MLRSARNDKRFLFSPDQGADVVLLVAAAEGNSRRFEFRFADLWTDLRFRQLSDLPVLLRSTEVGTYMFWTQTRLSWFRNYAKSAHQMW